MLVVRTRLKVDCTSSGEPHDFQVGSYNLGGGLHKFVGHSHDFHGKSHRSKEDLHTSNQLLTVWLKNCLILFFLKIKVVLPIINIEIKFCMMQMAGRNEGDAPNRRTCDRDGHASDGRRFDAGGTDAAE